MYLDGHNLPSYLTGESEASPEGVLLLLGRRRPGGVPLRHWEDRLHATAHARNARHLGRAVRGDAIPLLFNPRTDPFERADVTSNTYWDWYIDRVFLLTPAQAIVGEFLGTFIDFPPRMEAASFTIDQVQEKLEAAINPAAEPSPT